MTLWAVCAPTKTYLKILFILTLLLYQPADSQQCLNVGTVIFGQMDVLACCLDYEKYATLVFRRMVNNVIPVPLQQVKGDAYICAFLSFVQASSRAAVKGAPPTIARAFVTALFDVTGGYLRSYLLPVTFEGFYAGNVRFVEVRKLCTLYEDIKDYLHSNGQGWSLPKGKYGIIQKVRSLYIPPPEHGVSSCDNFMFNATGASPDTIGYCVMPIPFLDDNTHPTSVALPLRYGSLHSLEAPNSAYIVLGHYVRSVRCLQERAVSSNAFIDYNKKFRSWIVKHVMPRLGDERWYPAFGGVLRVLKKTGEFVHGEQSCQRAKNKIQTRMFRRRSPRKTNTKLTDTVINKGKDSIVERIADDLVPIDVAVLQKLMQATNEPITEEAIYDTQISVLPALKYFADTINKKLQEFQKLQTSKQEVILISTVNISPVSTPKNVLESVKKIIIDEHEATLKLVRRENKYTTSANEYSSKAKNNEGGSREIVFLKDNRDHIRLEGSKKSTDNISTIRVTQKYGTENTNEDDRSENKKYFSTPESHLETRPIDLDKITIKETYIQEQEQEIKGLTTFRARDLNTELQTVGSKILQTEGISDNVPSAQNLEKNNHVTDNIEESKALPLRKDKSEFDTSQKTTLQSIKKSIQPSPITIVKTKIAPTQKIDSVVTEYKFLSDEKSRDMHPDTSKQNSTIQLHEIPKNNRMASGMKAFRKVTTSVSDCSPIKKKSHLLVQPALRVSGGEVISSTSYLAEPELGSSPWLYSAVLTPSRREFSNMTDGCVQRTWDGVHAPAPYVSHLLASVLQSPAFNLDFIVCHMILSIFVWLLLFCASVGQYDCRSPWRKDEETCGTCYFGGETSPRPLLVQQTYYSLDGELPRMSPDKNSILGRCRESLCGLPIMRYGLSKEPSVIATKEETTPLTRHLSNSSRSHHFTQAKVNSNVHPSQQLVRMASANTDSQAHNPTFKSRNPVESQSEGSEEYSEEYECDQLISPEIKQL